MATTDARMDTTDEVRDEGSDMDSDVSFTPPTRGRSRTRNRSARGSRSATRSRGRGISARGRNAIPQADLFQWELYHQDDTYSPHDWLPSFERRTGKLLYFIF